jgi:nucleotidyltransferase substrate binding protein (TIGR01987 family)
MRLDCSALEGAVKQLETSLRYLDSEASRDDPELRKQFRAATIQAFEFTYELGTKMIRRQLEQIVLNPAELHGIAFMDLMRKAADAGLVREVRAFKGFREMRNLTSHVYDDAKAEAVLAVTGPFLEAMRFLVGELRRRNP